MIELLTMTQAATAPQKGADAGEPAGKAVETGVENKNERESARAGIVSLVIFLIAVLTIPALFCMQTALGYSDIALPGTT